MTIARLHRPAAVGAAVIAGALILTSCSSGTSEPEGSSSGDGGEMTDPVELTLLTGTVELNVQIAEAVAAGFNEANPDIVVTVDASMPSGSEGDNLLKTRLATGDAPDMFWYNSGSLLQALNPDSQLLNIADQSFLSNVQESFIPTVSTANGTYGVPIDVAGGGGIFYSIPIYEELGLEVPTTWDEFVANTQAIKDAGYDNALIQSFGDTWTSQIIMLADYYNIYNEDPDWADKYTANEAHYADTPIALRSFEKMQDLADEGLLNKDFASLTFDQALERMANGEGAQYPMLMFAIDTMVDLYPESADNIGYFAIPGDSASANGLTVWMPPAIYAPADTEHQAEVLRFMEYVASPDACAARLDAGVAAGGPFVVNGCTLPDDVPQAIKDMLPYFDNGNTAPALEFLSPIKGPSLEQILVEVGSGIRDAGDAAALYDEDVKKQAQQLGLDGW
ncbi:ABC transporter substrate-binding protein [Demequina zhanjiangensis]|uniref:ABC transporter substrate-binding protein n=1 Tax=Demequina zhanjiangensis TaxID=3051659 RepID=A0ABT8G470_9MICO|nr:ABC transporter substrate-binding protein [Demequina sp. SYSU T00b26]MDN4473812.1 ABC transporter substrate-binding protein [Demequina sp. SYSU T00b26]